jgi:WD40 repeat protein
MRAYRLIYLVLLFVSFSTYTPLHAQVGVTCPGFQPSRLTIGGQGQVTPGSSNNLRNMPSRTGDKIGEIPGGGSFTVLDGPVCAEDTAWWQVDYQGVSGWTVEGMGSEYWLQPLQVCESNLIVGEPAERMDYGNGQIYEQSSYNSAVLGEIPEWTLFDVIGGPHCSFDDVWIEVEYEGVQGWLLEVVFLTCDAYCSGPATYLNARLPLLPLETVVPDPGSYPFSQQQIVNLPHDAITPATSASVTTLKIVGDGFVRDYAWSPDASQLAVAGTVEVRIYETYRLTAPPRVLTGFSGVVNRALYSPDGRYLVTADMDGNVQLWDAETYDLLYGLDHGESVFGILFNADSSLLAARGEQGLSLWEMNEISEPQLRHRYGPGIGGGRRSDSLVFLPGKDELVDVQIQNVYVHHLITGETRQLLQENLSIHRGINTWALSPDGEYVTAILEEMIGDTSMAYWYYGFIWSVETGETVGVLDDPLLNTNGSRIPFLQLNYDPDGSHRLITTADQQDLQGSMMNTDGLFHLQGVTDAAYSPNGSLLAFGLSTGEVRLYIETQPLDVLFGITGAVSNLQFSPDGNHLVAKGSDGTLRVWNVETRQRLGTVSFISFPSEFWLASDQVSLVADQRKWDVASGQQGPAIALPEGSRLLHTRDDGRLLLRSDEQLLVYDPESEETVLEMPVRSDYYVMPIFSADGTRLAYIERSQHVNSPGVPKVVDLNDGMLIQTFQRQFEEPQGLFLSPDGTLLLLLDGGREYSEENDSKLLLWDIATGNLLHVVSTYDERTSSSTLTLSPDNSKIAWGIEGGVQIYDLLSQTSTTSEDVEGFEWYPQVFSFSADGSLVSIGDTVGGIHLFDTNTGDKIATLKGHISPVRKLVFSRDGRRLYSTADEGLLRIWGVP